MSAVLLSDVSTGVRWQQEKILLRHLIDRRALRMETAVDLLFGDRLDGGPLWARQIPGILMHRVRAKLRPGWAIPYYPTRADGWQLIQTTHMGVAA